MDGFVDIHSHLLPGIDDGPTDMAGTLAMAQAAAEAGTATLAATPHLRADFPGVHVREIAAACQRVQAEITAAGIALDVVAGAETSLIWAIDASEDDLRLATYGQRGSDLLVETPADVSTLEPLLYQLRLHGLRVILAHPERCSAFMSDLDKLVRLSEHGILLQVNADALLASKKAPGRRLAEHLCRQGLAHVLASDGHRGHEWRPVSALGDGVEALARLVGTARAQWMAVDVPAAILEGRELPPEPEVKHVRSGLWRRRPPVRFAAATARH